MRWPRVVRVAGFLMAVLAATSCDSQQAQGNAAGQPSVVASGNPPAGGLPAPQPFPAASGGPSGAPRPALHFKKFSCIDSQGLGGEAFSVLVPHGWRVAGSIEWRQDNPGFPAYAILTVAGPGDTAAFEVFPNLPFFWSNNPTQQAMFPPGSNYMGMTVRPLASAADVLTDIVVPNYRAHQAGLRIVSVEDAPELAGMVRSRQAHVEPLASIDAEAAKVRVEYTSDGRLMEEQFYGVVQTLSIPLSTWDGPRIHWNWWADFVCSFRAEKGRLDQVAGLLQTIAHSFRVNPWWFNRYEELVVYLVQNQIRQIHEIQRLARRWSRMNLEFSAMRRRQWEHGRAVRGRLSDLFGRSFRGAETYLDLEGDSEVELPLGFESAWANEDGEYVLSQDPDFDPNAGSGETWHRLNRR